MSRGLLALVEALLLLVIAASAAAAPAPPMGGGAGCTAPSKLGVVFIIDDSGSNTTTDPAELRRDAALVGVGSVPAGSLVSVSKFAGDAATVVGAQELTAASRGGILAAVQGMSLDEQFTGTNYEAAFQDALAKLGAMTAADKRIVVFLTDGEPTEPFSSDAQIGAAGVPIHSLGYGESGNAVLADISGRSGGKAYSLRGPADARSAFANIVDTLTCRSVFDPTRPRVPPRGTYKREFSVGTMTSYFRATVAWDDGQKPASIEFVRPDGSAFPIAGPARANESLVEGSGSVQLTVDNPKVGKWAVRVRGDPNTPVRLKVEAATASDVDPGQCPAGVQGEQKVSIGNAVAYGCFQKDAKGRHTTPYPARIGGFDADPDNDNLAPGREPNLLILDTAKGKIDVRGRVRLGLGGALLPGDPRNLPVGRKSWEFTLDKTIRCKDRRRKQDCELGARPRNELEAADVDLWGFDVAGTVKASWIGDGNGGSQLEFAPRLDKILRPLVERVFQTKDPMVEAGGAGSSLVKAALQVRATNDKGFELGLSELTINPFKIVDKPRKSGLVTSRFAWPVGVSARGENKAFGDRSGYLWTFEVIIGFPRRDGLKVQGRRKIPAERLPDLGAAGRVFVFDGSLAGGGAEVSGLNVPLGATPLFLQRAGLNLLFRPGFGLDAQVGLSGGPKILDEALVEGDPIAFRVGTLAQCQTSASQDNLPFELSGTLKIRPAEKAGATAEFSAKVCYILGDNAVEVEGGVKVLWLGETLGVQGSLKGWVDDSKFNIDGDGSIKIPGLPDPSGSIVVSSVGVAGCGDVAFFKGGAGYRWGGSPDAFRGCDLGPWRQSRAATASVVHAAQANSFRVRRRVKFVGFRVRGQGGAPVVRVTSPNGEVFDSPAGPQGVVSDAYVSTKIDQTGHTFVFIRRPRRGRWTVTPIGGAPVTAVETTLPVPRPRVRGRVAGRGGVRTLRYRVRAIRGQRVAFFERGRGTAKRIGTAKRSRGRIRFRPSRAGSGRRVIVASVVQAGAPRANLRVDRYRVRTARGRAAGRVRAIAVRGSRRSGHVLRWSRAPRAGRYYLSVRYRGRTLRRGFSARRRKLPLGRLRRGSRVRISVQPASRSRLVRPPTTRTIRIRR